MNEPELPLLNTQSSHEIVKKLAISDLLLLQKMRADTTGRNGWKEEMRVKGMMKVSCETP
jgi:hypothetical protein